MKTRLSSLFAAVLFSLTTATAFVAAPQATAADASATASAPAAAPAAEAAPAAASTDVAAPAAAKETVENPYGLDALWKGGDFVARSTLIIMAIMSMGSWYILITKFVEACRRLIRRQRVEQYDENRTEPMFCAVFFMEDAELRASTRARGC